MFLQALVLILSVTSAFLASLSDPKLTSLIAAVTGGITAWQEFTAVAKKLERYSNVSHGLGDILMWWQSLPEINQAVVECIEQLFKLTEELISSEHTAWLSDAKLARQLAEGTEEEKGGEKTNAEEKKAQESKARERTQAKISEIEAAKSKMDREVSELKAD